MKTLAVVASLALWCLSCFLFAVLKIQHAAAVAPPMRSVVIQCRFDNGKPCAADITLYQITTTNGITTKTGIESWKFSNGTVTIGAPIVNTGTYEYDFTENGKFILPSYTFQAGAFYSFLSALKSGITFNITVSATTGLLSSNPGVIYWW